MYVCVCVCVVSTERDVALKKVRLEDDGNGVPWNAIREVASLKHLQHPKIVTMLDLVIDVSGCIGAICMMCVGGECGGVGGDDMHTMNLTAAVRVCVL